jgi:hypothetical protein
MAEAESSVTVDPELQRQLGAASANNQPVEVVVRLRPDDPSQIVPSPARTKQLAEKIMTRVGKRVGNRETRHNIFANLGSLVVSGSPEFVRELISQPEVAAAVANQQPDTALPPSFKKTTSGSHKQNQAAPSSRKRKRIARR